MSVLSELAFEAIVSGAQVAAAAHARDLESGHRELIRAGRIGRHAPSDSSSGLSEVNDVSGAEMLRRRIAELTRTAGLAFPPPPPPGQSPVRFPRAPLRDALGNGSQPGQGGVHAVGQLDASIPQALVPEQPAETDQSHDLDTIIAPLAADGHERARTQGTGVFELADHAFRNLRYCQGFGHRWAPIEAIGTDWKSEEALTEGRGAAQWGWIGGRAAAAPTLPRLRRLMRDTARSVSAEPLRSPHRSLLPSLVGVTTGSSSPPAREKRGVSQTGSGAIPTDSSRGTSEDTHSSLVDLTDGARNAVIAGGGRSSHQQAVAAGSTRVYSMALHGSTSNSSADTSEKYDVAGPASSSPRQPTHQSGETLSGGGGSKQHETSSASLKMRQNGVDGITERDGHHQLVEEPVVLNHTHSWQKRRHGNAALPSASRHMQWRHSGSLRVGRQLIAPYQQAVAIPPSVAQRATGQSSTEQSTSFSANAAAAVGAADAAAGAGVQARPDISGTRMWAELRHARPGADAEDRADRDAGRASSWVNGAVRNSWVTDDDAAAAAAAAAAAEEEDWDERSRGDVSGPDGSVAALQAVSDSVSRGQPSLLTPVVAPLSDSGSLGLAAALLPRQQATPHSTSKQQQWQLGQPMRHTQVATNTGTSKPGLVLSGRASSTSTSRARRWSKQHQPSVLSSSVSTSHSRQMRRSADMPVHNRVFTQQQQQPQPQPQQQLIYIRRQYAPSGLWLSSNESDFGSMSGDSVRRLQLDSDEDDEDVSHHTSRVSQWGDETVTENEDKALSMLTTARDRPTWSASKSLPTQNAATTAGDRPTWDTSKSKHTSKQSQLEVDDPSNEPSSSASYREPFDERASHGSISDSHRPPSRIRLEVGGSIMSGISAASQGRPMLAKRASRASRTAFPRMLSATSLAQSRGGSYSGGGSPVEGNGIGNRLRRTASSQLASLSSQSPVEDESEARGGTGRRGDDHRASPQSVVASSTKQSRTGSEVQSRQTKEEAGGEEEIQPAVKRETAGDEGSRVAPAGCIVVLRVWDGGWESRR